MYVHKCTQINNYHITSLRDVTCIRGKAVRVWLCFFVLLSDVLSVWLGKGKQGEETERRREREGESEERQRERDRERGYVFSCVRVLYVWLRWCVLICVCAWLCVLAYTCVYEQCDWSKRTQSLWVCARTLACAVMCVCVCTHVCVCKRKCTHKGELLCICACERIRV